MTPAEIRLIGRRMTAFEAGSFAASARGLRLAGRAVGGALRAAVDAGFRFSVEPLRAERSRQGKEQFCCAGGTVTDDPTHPDVALVFVGVHEDGGIVRVYPSGRPSAGTLAGESPFATKAALLRSPVVQVRPDRRTRLLAHTSERNIAFFVSDEGDALPKSLRAPYVPVLREAPAAAFAILAQWERDRIIRLGPPDGDGSRGVSPTVPRLPP